MRRLLTILPFEILLLSAPVWAGGGGGGGDAVSVTVPWIDPVVIIGTQVALVGAYALLRRRRRRLGHHTGS